ncbi:tuberin [Planococcus citri]|uniref:tuberin n=1 Tax=Planococcus citri TaxID=170843 RepID=UPI0031F76B94
MSGKEGKPFEKFKQELKQFFKGNKHPPGTVQMRLRDEFALDSELKRQLQKEVPIDQRMKAINELKDIVLHTTLEKNAIEKICNCVNDILTDPRYKEHRRDVIYFYQSLVFAQYDRLENIRPYFFNIIKNVGDEKDIIARFELLQKLTQNGKNINALEEEIGMFLLEWMETNIMLEKPVELLSVLVNYVKYNSSFIDEDVIDGIVQNACYICCQSDIESVVSVSLELLDTVVCYSKLSQQTMVAFISAVSRTICLEEHNVASWKIMRNLLGTHMGHFCLQTLCAMLLDNSYHNDTGLISGIIYILNMALLGNKPDCLAGCIPMYIIPSISKVSKLDDPIVLVEVLLSMKWTVENYGQQLKDPTWDEILNILESVISKIGQWDYPNPLNYICDIFNKVESLLRKNECNADMDKLLSFCQKWSAMMPEAFIFYLTDYYFNRIISTDWNWTSKIHPIVSTFLIKETRPSIRIHLLKTLVKIIEENSWHYEKEIMNNIVKPYFDNFAFEKDDTIRNTTLDFLIRSCKTCQGIYMESILDILEKVLRTPFDQKEIISESNKSDLKKVVGGLLDIFAFCVHELPSSNAIKILDILVTFLKCHYDRPKILESLIDVRWKIVDFLLRLRADSNCRIGYIDSSNTVEYSCYILADHKRSSNSSFSSSSRVNSKSSEGSCSSFEEEFYDGYVLTYISLTNACRVIVTTLKHESDWELLESILLAIPTALKNRALVFSKYNSEVESIVQSLILMITEKDFTDKLKNLPPKFSKPSFYGCVIPVLSAFASYHTHLEYQHQQRLISCLHFGLVYKSAPQCVTALMICLLEMREAMVKLLPEILLNLSKISATVHVAIPILEFLSLLTTFPQVYANFIPNQYMSIFAIIFPYTNSFKYNHYVVSLAHHVIAVWFLKCRRPLRRDFVKYIIKGVKSHLGSFEEENFPKPVVANEDSSNRKRSSSLTEQGNRKKERHMSGSGRLMSQGAGGASDLRKNYDETSITFHRELTETCIDLMSRNAFTSFSALPRRNPGTEFILRNGNSLTWLLGNNIITVNTSGCTQKPMYNGYCDKCFVSCTIDKKLQFLNINGGYKQTENTDTNNSSDGTGQVQKSAGKQLTRHLSINSEDGNLTDSLKASSSSESNFETDEKRITDGIELNKQSSINKEDRESYNFCPCWCQGWAEIHIRRPTGDISWIMRSQNETCYTPYRNPLADISSLYQASVIHEGIKLLEKQEQEQKEAAAKPTAQFSVDNSENPVKEYITELPPVKTGVELRAEVTVFTPNTVGNVVSDSKQVVDISKDDSKCCETNVVDDEQDGVPIEGESNEHCCHGRNPVRRSNSSPEMSSNWKNAFAKDSSRSFNSSPVNAAEQCESSDQCSLMDCKKSGKHCYSKELRCNCEAIPEEFPGLGTTPPKTTQITAITSVETISDVESSINSPSPSISSGNISQCEKSSSTPQLPPSSSYENFNVNEHKKQTETKFFDEQGLPNDDFEFSRSASTSQVTSSFKKHPPSASYVSLSHGLTSSQPHLTSKPPPSPPIYSLRSMKHGKFQDSAETSHSDSFSNLDYKRNRVHTISVMSPTKKSQSEWDSRNKFPNQTNYDSKKSGLNPSFVFLQLYDSSMFFESNEKPIPVHSSTTIQRAINVFDRIPPYETHKVGVIYVGPGQANNEKEILSNTNGSVRYVQFLSKLGTLVRLADVNSQNIFLGGLEQNGNDGKYAYIWKDDIMQVIFHVATLMPNKENDVNCNNKKKHIGNDLVSIVYNESGEEYNLNTVKCQYNFASIIIEPLDHDTNQLTVKAKDDLLEIIGNVDTKIVSDTNVSLLARQLALHINLASLVLSSMNKDRNCGGIYASNWLERLRKIKQIRKKVIEEKSASTSQTEANKQATRNYYCDFTDYT